MPLKEIEKLSLSIHLLQLLKVTGIGEIPQLEDMQGIEVQLHLGNQLKIILPTVITKVFLSRYVYEQLSEQ